MVGKITSLSIALLLAAGFALADEDAKDTNKDAKKPKYTTLIGNFESYKDEKLTLTIDGEKKKFEVPEDTPVGFVIGKDKTKVVKAKDNLKDVKKGSIVSLTMDGKKVLAVGVTELPKDKAKSDDEKGK